MSPGSHKLVSTDAGIWRAPGSKKCRWTYTYRTTPNGPVKKTSGRGRNPVVTIGAYGIRLTSDYCGVFTKD